MNNEEKRELPRAEIPLVSSPAPHIRHEDTSRSIMLDVIIALTPALIWGIICFGIRALGVVLLSVLSVIAFDIGTEYALHRKLAVCDLSTVLTGLLLGLTLPAGVPYYVPVIGSFFAIVAVKKLLGGMGKVFVNPALAARALISLLPFAAKYTEPFTRLSLFASGDAIDAVSAATPLDTLAGGALPVVTWADILTGKIGGSIGEVSTVLLLIGGIYLLARRVISWHIPVAYLGTVALFCAIFPQNTDVLAFTLCHLLSGGLVFAAFFMATDYFTSPVTAKGRLVFGVGCGILTVIIRYFLPLPEGVAFAVIIMNPLARYIDIFTRPRVFGKKSRG